MVVIKGGQGRRTLRTKTFLICRIISDWVTANAARSVFGWKMELESIAKLKLLDNAKQVPCPV
jgi:hypothetical protein